MEKFDWEKCEEKRNNRVYTYFAANFDSEVGEEKFVQDMWLLQHAAHTKGEDRRNYVRRRRHWNRNHLHREYRKLQSKFGFFLGV